MTQVEASKTGIRGPQVLPLSVKAYHALGEMGLIPEQTELLYGQVFCKMSKSPVHSFLALRLLRLLQALIPPGYLCRPEQPITCHDSEPEPDLAVVHGREEDFRQEHPCTAELVIEVCVTSPRLRPLQTPRLRQREREGVLVRACGPTTRSKSTANPTATSLANGPFTVPVASPPVPLCRRFPWSWTPYSRHRSAPVANTGSGCPSAFGFTNALDDP